MHRSQKTLVHQRSAYKRDPTAASRKITFEATGGSAHRKKTTAAASKKTTVEANDNAVTHIDTDKQPAPKRDNKQQGKSSMWMKHLPPNRNSLRSQTQTKISERGGGIVAQ